MIYSNTMSVMDNVELHPVVEGIQSLGCKSKSKISLAIQVYLDLCEVKCMWNPQYKFDPSLDIIYITGKWSKNDKNQEIVVPLSASSSVTPAWLLEVQNKFCGEEETKMVTLAFIASDSSICYYQACEGLQPPDSPEKVQKRRAKEERKQCRAVEMMQKAQDLISEVIENDSNQESENGGTSKD